MFGRDAGVDRCLFDGGGGLCGLLASEAIVDVPHGVEPPSCRREATFNVSSLGPSLENLVTDVTELADLSGVAKEAPTSLLLIGRERRWLRQKPRRACVEDAANLDIYRQQNVECQMLRRILYSVCNGMSL